MAVSFIPIGAFSPGGSDYGSDLAEARGVVPVYGSYFPLRQRAAVAGGSLSTTEVTGCHAHVFPTGLGTGGAYSADKATFFAGDRTGLYSFSVGWNNISKGGGYAGAGVVPAGWRFASYGNDIWGVNCYDNAQRRTANAGNFADGITSTFKPVGRFIAPVREFMLIASLANVGRSADEFCWSDINDPTWFDDRTNATRPASLAGSKIIRSRPGQIVGMLGGEFGRIFKRRSIHALQFSGGSTDVWRLDEISPKIGLALPSSLIDGEDAAYFWSGRSFYRQEGLSAPEKISPPAIDQLFTDGIHFGDQGMYHKAMDLMVAEDAIMFGVEDWRTGLKFWFYRSGFANPAVNTPLNAFVAFDPETGLWARSSSADLTGGLAFQKGMAYPENSNEETGTESVRILFFNLNSTSGNSDLSMFSGASEAAVLHTQKQVIQFDQMSPTGRYRINGVLPVFTVPTSNAWASPVVAPAAPTVTVTVQASNDVLYTRQADTDGTVIAPRNESYTTAQANDWGWLPHSVEGRAWDFTLSIPAGTDWRALTGLWINGDPIP